jgi:pullulanase/glycogen debranching enzyme
MTDTAELRGATGTYTLQEGNTALLGATPTVVDGQEGVNFSIYAGVDATRVDLCLFDKYGENEQRLSLYDAEENICYSRQQIEDEQGHVCGFIYSAFIPAVPKDTLYGYRVDGPYEPESGKRYNYSKLLIDPWAKALEGEVVDDASLFSYKDAANVNRNGEPENTLDSADFVPKARIVDTAGIKDRYRAAAPASHAPNDTIVCEVHPKGATKLNYDVPEQHRGTFAALADPAFLREMKRLNMTAVELMPVDTKHHDQQGYANRGNYWGYMTLGYFAPESGYAVAGYARLAAELRDHQLPNRMAGMTRDRVTAMLRQYQAEESFAQALDEAGLRDAFEALDNPSQFEEVARQHWQQQAGTNPDSPFHAGREVQRLRLRIMKRAVRAIQEKLIERGEAVWPEEELASASHMLRENGLDVIYDVVFNHTGEGNEFGPTVLFRGFDNSMYRWHDGGKHYFDTTGTGNSLTVAHPMTQRLIEDALRHKIELYHASGNRWDLGSTLFREPPHYHVTPYGFAGRLVSRLEAEGYTQSMEGWDTGEGTPHTRGLPVGHQWNGEYRDEVNKLIVTPHTQPVRQLTYHMSGSDRVDFRGPLTTVYIGSHDGATLPARTTSDHIHGDGHDLPHSSFHDVAQILYTPDYMEPDATPMTGLERMEETQRRIQSFAWSVLTHSQGMPLILHGDYQGQLSARHNNTYFLDSEDSWTHFIPVPYVLRPQVTEAIATAVGLEDEQTRFLARNGNLLSEYLQGLDEFSVLDGLEDYSAITSNCHGFSSDSLRVLTENADDFKRFVNQAASGQATAFDTVARICGLHGYMREALDTNPRLVEMIPAMAGISEPFDASNGEHQTALAGCADSFRREVSNSQMREFLTGLTEFRHSNPTLRRRTFLPMHDTGYNGLKHVQWLHPDGHEVQQHEWEHLTGISYILGGDAGWGFRSAKDAKGNPLLVMINMEMNQHWKRFKLPETYTKEGERIRWIPRVNSSTLSTDLEGNTPLEASDVELPYRSMMVFEGVPERLIQQETTATQAAISR